jgi:hypothetical protein
MPRDTPASRDGPCRRAAASVVVEHLCAARHALQPIPCLAFVPLALSAVRQVHLCSARKQSFFAEIMRWRDPGVALPRADALGFLAAAPLNVSRITVWHAMASDTPGLVATLRLHACHGFLTHLHFLEDTYHGHEDEDLGERHMLTHESSLDLLAATGGLRHVRSLQVAGECWPVIDAVRRTVRRLGVAQFTGPALLDLSDFPQLRRLSELYDCAGLTEVRLPPALTALGEAAFCELPSVTAIDLAHTRIATIGDHCLQCWGEGAVPTLALPPTLVSVGSCVLQECALAAVDLTATALETVGDHFLRGCRALATVALPPTLRVIGSGAFKGCEKLRAIDLSRCPALSAVGAPFMAACGGFNVRPAVTVLRAQLPLLHTEVQPPVHLVMVVV